MYQVEGEDGLYRDPSTNAIINKYSLITQIILCTLYIFITIKLIIMNKDRQNKDSMLFLAIAYLVLTILIIGMAIGRIL